jgi:hypothetical protein
MKDVPRPPGKRGVDFRTSSLQAEVILTTLTAGGAKRIPIVGDYKAAQNRLRFWFQRHHPTLAFHYQLTEDGTALDCWVTRRKPSFNPRAVKDVPRE